MPAQAEVRRLGPGVVLRDERLVDETFERSWKLNRSGRLVVSYVAEGADADLIVERLSETLAVEPETIHRDVQQMLALLERRRLLDSRRRSVAMAIHQVQQKILQHPAIFTIQMKLVRAFDWYFGILRRILGSSKP